MGCPGLARGLGAFWHPLVDPLGHPWFGPFWLGVVLAHCIYGYYTIFIFRLGPLNFTYLFCFQKGLCSRFSVMFGTICHSVFSSVLRHHEDMVCRMGGM